MQQQRREKRKDLRQLSGLPRRSFRVAVLIVACALLASPSVTPGPNSPVPDLEQTVIASEVRDEISAEDSSRALAMLGKELDRILADRYVRKSTCGIAISSLVSGKTLYSRNAEKLFTPASTTKMFATSAALYYLGSDYNVPTTVYTDAPVVEDGLLDGNLYVVGYGDPLLETPDIEILADQIRNLGIDSISGSIYADGSYFDNVYSRFKYSGDADEVQKLPPVAGLTINRNRINVRVSAPSRSGRRLYVQTVPDCDAFSFVVSATSSKGRNYRRSVRVSSSLAEDGRQQIAVRGRLRTGRSYVYTLDLRNPPMVAASLLYNRLLSGGVAIAGGFDVRKLPIHAAVLTEYYHSLEEIIAGTNKRSDNFLAENVFKLIGAYSGVDKSTAREAVTMIHTSLDERNISCRECVINDGSGLSRRNLFSPLAQVNLLQDAVEQPFGEVFYSSLSVAGVDGTLKGRMIGSLAANNLVGKTGTLRNVSALAGYVTTQDGERLAFSFLFNGRYVSHFKKLENQLGMVLANFSYSQGLTRG